MAEKEIEITIIVEKNHENYNGGYDEYRSVIRDPKSTSDIWQSDWCDSPMTVFKKAAKILAKMPTDFLYAAKHNIQIKDEE
jgi:hypothetical protein